VLQKATLTSIPACDRQDADATFETYAAIKAKAIGKTPAGAHAEAFRQQCDRSGNKEVYSKLYLTANKPMQEKINALSQTHEQLRVAATEVD